MSLEHALSQKPIHSLSFFSLNMFFSIYLGNLSTIHGEFDITREQFEAIARPTLMRSIKIVNRALRQAKFTVAQIDEVKFNLNYFLLFPFKFVNFRANLCLFEGAFGRRDVSNSARLRAAHV